MQEIISAPAISYLGKIVAIEVQPHQCLAKSQLGLLCKSMSAGKLQLHAVGNPGVRLLSSSSSLTSQVYQRLNKCQLTK